MLPNLFKYGLNMLNISEDINYGSDVSDQEL